MLCLQAFARRQFLPVALTLAALGASPPPEPTQSNGDPPVASGRILAPTTIPADLSGRSPGAAVAELERVTGLPVRLADGEPGVPAPPGPVTLPGPATFWEVVDRLIRDARLEPTTRQTKGERWLELRPIARPTAPAVVQGIFRCSLVRLEQSRRIVYGDPILEVSSRARPRSTHREGGGMPPTWQDDQAQLLILAEPRKLIDFQLAGPPRIDEATDDQGRSLIVPPPGQDGPYNYEVDHLLISLKVRLPLDLGDLPTRSIRRLRGAVPVVVWTLHPEPLEINLLDPVGTTRQGAGVTLRLLAPTPGKPAPGAVTVELHPDQPNPPRPSALVLFEAGPDRLFLDLSQQVEVCDEAGKPIPVSIATKSGDVPYSSQVRLTPRPGTSPRPTRLRFYPLTWSRVEIPFDFTEVPLP